MTWFPLRGDERLARCASKDCFGQPTWRLEAHGFGANYCSGCKVKIEDRDHVCQISTRDL